MWDVTNTAESSHLSTKAAAAQKALLQAMQSVCCVNTKYFRNINDTHELQGDKDLGESFNLIKCGPPYKLHRMYYLQKSNHDVFNALDMDAFCEFWKLVLNRENVDKIFVQPYSLLPDGGVFVFARNKLKRMLGKLNCFRRSRHRCSAVLSTVTICKTHH